MFRLRSCASILPSWPATTPSGSTIAVSQSAEDLSFIAGPPAQTLSSVDYFVGWFVAHAERRSTWPVPTTATILLSERYRDIYGCGTRGLARHFPGMASSCAASGT